MSASQATSGLILAGGAGRRMGGADKGWIHYQGRPLVEQVFERLAPQVDQVLISANRNLARYAAFGVPVLADGDSDFRGPLAGIEAGLRSAAPGWVLCVPCDSPALPADLAQRLHAGVAGGKAAVVALAGRWQPVFCLLHTSLADALSAYLARGDRKVASWLESVDARTVDFSDEASAFANLNSPEMLAP